MKQNHFNTSCAPLPGLSGAGGLFDSPTAPTHKEFPNSISSQGTLRLLALLSAGPISGLANGAQSIFIDDVPLCDADGNYHFPDISWSLARGDETTSPHNANGFNAVEQTQAISRTLLPAIPQDYSRQSAHAVRVAVRFPQGLYARLSTLTGPAEVVLIFSSKIADKWQEVRRARIFEKQTAAFEMQFQILLPQSDSAQFIRIETISSDKDTDDRFVRRVDITALTWVQWDRLSYHGMGTVGLVIGAQATDGRIPRLSFDVKGREILVPSSYDPKTRIYKPIWDGQFVRAYSNNPAWVIYDLLTDKTFGLGLSKQHIAIFDLLAIARHCDEMIAHPGGGKAPRHSFNAIITKRQSATRLIQDICASIRALFYWSGGKLHFSQDTEIAASRMVNNHGIEDGRFLYSGPAIRHAYSHVFVSYHDKARQGQLAVQTAFDEKIHAEYGYRPLEVFAFGCTDRAEAIRHARWLLVTNHNSGHAISYIASLDHYTDDPVRPGDVIAIQDEQLNHKDSTSQNHMRRLLPESVLYQNDASVSLKDMKGGAARYIIKGGIKSGFWRVYFQKPNSDLQSEIAYVFNQKDGSDFQQISFYDKDDTSKPLADTLANHTLLSLHPVNEEVSVPLYRVSAIRELSGQRVEVTALRYHSAHFAALDQDISAADEVITDTLQLSVPLPSVKGLKATQEDIWHNGILRRQLVITWDDNRTTSATNWVVQVTNPDGVITRYSASEPKHIVEDAIAGIYDISVRLQRYDGYLAPEGTITSTIKQEITPLPKPAKPLITAMPQALSFTFPKPAIDGAIVAYEIWHADTPSKEHKKLASAGSDTLLFAVTNSGTQSYRWRYLRASGLASVLSDAVIIAPLPAGQKGEKGDTGAAGADGLAGPKGDKGDKGDAGAAGADGLAGPKGDKGDKGEIGQSGNDGENGIDGTQIAKANVTIKSWSDTAAASAIHNQISRLPRDGDVVTLVNQAQSYSETRRYDGTSWQANIGLLSGTILLDHTVPSSALQSVSAKQIQGGVFQSSNFQQGNSGFAINTAGNAEFNEAILRGTLSSGRIEASHILAPIITLPTEASGRFQTHFLNRVVAPSLIRKSGSTVVFGPMVVSVDGYNHLFNDGGDKILSSADKKGDSANSTQNSFFTRFRSNAPLIKARIRFAQPANNWGKGIKKLAITVKIRAGDSHIIQSTPALALNQFLFDNSLVNFASQVKKQFAGFQGSVSYNITRRHIARPGYSSANHGCTTLYEFDIAMRPIISPSLGLTDKPLYLTCDISANAVGLSNAQITDAIITHSTVEMDSLS